MAGGAVSNRKLVVLRFASVHFYFPCKYRRTPGTSSTQVEWAVSYYDVLQNTVGGGKPKMKWHFNQNSWPTFAREGARYPAPATAAEQDALVDHLQVEPAPRPVYVCSAAPSWEKSSSFFACEFGFKIVPASGKLWDSSLRVRNACQKRDLQSRTPTPCVYFTNFFY